MALQQSAFNFDFVPEDKKPAADDVSKDLKDKKNPGAEKVNKTERIDEQIREVAFGTAENPVKSQPAGTGKEKRSTRGRMKLSDMNAVNDLIEVPGDEVLFQKRYYSIGSVSEMFKVNVSLIRFWENEFDILKPKKNAKGDRHFRPEDVKNLQLIYHLLRDRKYTIEGAKEFLKKNRKAEEHFAVIENLQKLKSFLNELKANF